MSEQHELIAELKAHLLQEDAVVAAWLEGSFARNESDDFSDIDLWISVKDNAFDDFIENRERFVAEFGTVVSVLYPKKDIQTDDLDAFQVIYEDRSPYERLDVYVQKQSRQAPFTQDSAAEECEVLFEKEPTISYEPLDKAEAENYARDLFADVVTRFWHRIPRLKALLERNDLLESMRLYMTALEDLIFMERMEHSPEKIDWGYKDVEYDLPEKSMKQLYELMPKLQKKTVQKSLKQLASAFDAQAVHVSHLYNVEYPDALVSYITDELL